MEKKERAIEKLSAEVIGQIAAGEVVERPAAVVKELVENSIDAGAKAITVELREGGIQYLRVSDNGKGIPASQIRMAFERHATSKIVRSEDLFDIHTLGFRGEALASIAAVAKMALTTRTVREDFGVRAQVEAGSILDIREAATPVGTTIVVQNLFFNTPVRLKFLKRPAQEAAMVADYMLRLILSKPEISFRFVSQGKTVYQSVGDGTLESAIYCVYGKEALSSMHKVSGQGSGICVEGYVGVGELARGNRQQQSFFVNGRFFKEQALSNALEEGSRGVVMVGKFPCCILSLTVPFSQVDVNVHPNKLEVRFQNPAGVCGIVEEAVRNALNAYTLQDRLNGKGVMVSPQPQEHFVLVPLKDGDTQSQPEANQTQQLQDCEEGKNSAGDLEENTMPDGKNDVPLQEALPAQWAGMSVLRSTSSVHLAESTAPARIASVMERTSQPLSPDALVGYRKGKDVSVSPSDDAFGSVTPGMKKTVRGEDAKSENRKELFVEPVQESMLVEGEHPLRLVGIAFQTYWLFESGERLLWVDQHAAHERILYDRFWGQYATTRVSQRMMSPQLVRVTAQEKAMLSQWQPLLEAAGFDVRPFDETSVAIHAIPTFFGENESPKELLLQALDECQTQRGGITLDRLRAQIAQMACKRAIKGGDTLTPIEVEHLLQSMLKTGILPTCPHGRPIVVEGSRREMEKRFKRIP